MFKRLKKTQTLTMDDLPSGAGPTYTPDLFEADFFVFKNEKEQQKSFNNFKAIKRRRFLEGVPAIATQEKHFVEDILLPFLIIKKIIKQISGLSRSCASLQEINMKCEKF